MSISAVCPNGHKLTAKEKLAGKRVKCPKCEAVVQIPELEVLELDEVLVSDESASQSEPETDWLANDQSSNAADDRLDLGPGLDEIDPLTGGSLPSFGDAPVASAEMPSLPGSAYAAAPVQRPANQQPAKQESAAKFSPVLILATAGGGSFIGMLLVGLIGWLLFGGSSDKEVAVSNPPAPAAAALEPQSPQPAASPPNSAQPTPPTPEPAPAPVVPMREPLPFDLVRMNLDPRLDGFKLPGMTWASAYDEATGRLAITNDEKGVLIYDLDEVWKGEPGPVATILTQGLPTAVCLKPLPDRRVFVVAGLDAPELLLVDADTLEPAGKLVLNELNYVHFVTGSSNPEDPYVYYATQIHKAENPKSLEEDDSETSKRLGRVDLLTGKQDPHTSNQYVDLVISPDGRRVYTRTDSGSGAAIGAWSDLLKFIGSGEPALASGLSNNFARSPVNCIGELVAESYGIYTPSMSMIIGRADFMPYAAFSHQAVVVGLAKDELVFGSANDYQRLVSVPLPANWFDTTRWNPPIDVRLRHGLAPNIRTGYLDFQADSTRGAALITMTDHLVVASLSRAKVTPEPSLLVSASPPAKVVVGESVQVELEPSAEGAVFEFVPNTDWLPNEKIRVLGQQPPGEPTPKLLELGFGVTEDDTSVRLKSYEPLAQFKMPFKLRMGKEVMVATKYEGDKLVVQRTKPVAHGFSERIEVVDDEGRTLTKAAPAAKPLGTRLILAAGVNNQQSTIFIRNLDALAGAALPAKIQIGDEKMTLVSVDDFRDSLTVERTEPVAHDVTSDAWLLEEGNSSGLPESPPSLPVVQGNTFQWTPSADQVGKQVIRMRASVGNVTHDFFWEILVELPTAELPFQVAGIEPQRGTNLAVVWGQSSGLAADDPVGVQTEPAVYFVGIYDLAEKKLLRHTEIPKPILSAALHETGVYASLIAFDTVPKTDRQAELERQRAMSQATPTQIVRFDVETLKIADQVTISTHAQNLLVVADKYLAGFARGETFRFDIPKLTPVEPVVRGYEYPVAGRVGDGWVWDGVLWDSEMREARLLIYPVHFARPPGARSSPHMIAALGGSINTCTQGPYASTWFPINHSPENNSGGRSNQIPVGQYRLNDFPASLSYWNGGVHAHSWAAASRTRVDGALKPTSVQLIDTQKLLVKSGNTYAIKQTSAHLTEADGQVYVALLGKLLSVPLDQLVQNEEAFRFVEQQDKFVLDVDRPAKLRYSAPGAAKYHLQLWYQKPTFWDDEPAMTAVSTDGTFELALSDTQQYVSYALSAVGAPSSPRAANAKQDLVDKYLKQIAPAYQRLTHSKPKGVPFPVYISVIAEHEDGQQKAGLAHCYLLEVPIKMIRDAANW